MSSDNDRLFRAAKEGLVDEMKDLLRHSNVDINSKDEDQDTALIHAVTYQNRGVVEVLLEKGADVNLKDSKGFTPLMLAIFADFTEGIEMLLSTKNVKLDTKSDNGWTLLMAAAFAGNYKTARLLLKSKKVDINSQTKKGDTALIKAVYYRNVKIVRLLLQYGAIRSLKGEDGMTAQDVAAELHGRSVNFRERADPIMELFGILPIAFEDEEISDTIQQESSPRLVTDDDQLLMSLTSLSWTAVGSYKTRNSLKAVDLSFMPKDKLKRKVYDVLGKMNHIMEGKTDMKPFPSESRRRPVRPDQNNLTLPKQWVWVHVPSNNILWVRWAIQHLPASYKMTDRINLIAVIDEALEEVKRSSNCRQVHCTKMGDVISVVMPYFTTETGAFLDSRQHQNDLSDLRSRTMWKLVDEYGPQSTVKEQKNTIRIPQTLDQSYFATSRPLEGQDIDQVIYRYTKEADNKKAKLLMINQVWIWQVGNFVVTAFPESWTEGLANTLLDKLNGLCNERIAQNPHEFVQHILGQCIIISDEPGYGGLGESETWVSIFAKSIVDRGQVETEHYKEFSEYIYDVSNRNRLSREQSKNDVELDREFKALYDIYPETEGLRQTRNIRDELKMIEKIIENQETVIKGWTDTDTPETFTNKWSETNDQYGCNFLGKRKSIKKLDGEAEGVEKRFNQLLDLKQKQGSLSFARDADKRDRENEKQSQLLFAFTVITIVFTPLNFVAAFLAIPTKDYPHQGDNVNWRWWQSFVGMLVTEIMFVPTIWFGMKSTYVQELLGWIGERYAKAKQSSKNNEDLIRSNKGPGLV
ncbi:hypothetical protein MMC29_003027 [Sticta canariensis]|nr:hypothetical protein [Sticta canariensis]